MLAHVLAGFACFHLALPLGQAVRCYHCYDSFTSRSLALGSLQDHDYDHGQEFVRCDKNQIKWNAWDCPDRWPVCIFMSAKVGDHDEVVRTCAVDNFCLSYNPPPGVKLETCRQCNTTLCNDYSRVPDPPVKPGPLITFNININLNLKNHPYVADHAHP